MVVKLIIKNISKRPQFENGVVLYGSQTGEAAKVYVIEFENGVVLYGSQTKY